MDCCAVWESAAIPYRHRPSVISQSRRATPDCTHTRVLERRICPRSRPRFRRLFALHEYTTSSALPVTCQHVFRSPSESASETSQRSG